METPRRDRKPDRHSSTRRNRAARRFRLLLCGGGVGLLLAVGLPAPASAVPPPAQPEDLDSLVSESEALGEEYRGELRDMEGVIQAAEEATERVEDTQAQIDEARGAVRDLAVSTYMNGGIDPAMSVFVAEDPDELVARGRYVEHLTYTNSETIDRLSSALEDHEAAQAEAEEALAEAEADLEELQGRREEVQEQIADYPAQEMGPPDSLTPRTRQMRDLIIEEFGEGPAVGCYRPHDGGAIYGEHPKGRACDFMMTNDGVMPPQNQIDRGWAIAEWARDNAERLGVMYVIYRQQIWDVRRGDTDWRDMADRGSITENHFDHVHISMY